MSNYTAMGLDLGVPEDSSTIVKKVLVVSKGYDEHGDLVYSVLASPGLHQVEVDELASFAKTYTTELVRSMILRSRPYQAPDDNERPEEK